MSSSQSSSSSSSGPQAVTTRSSQFAPFFDVTCRVEVILGSSVITVRDCLDMHKDTIIRVDQAAGSDMQIVINGVSIAKGTVLVVEDMTSIRVTDILPPPSVEL